MTSQYSKESERFLGQREIHSEWESNYLNPAMDRFYDRVFARIVDELGARTGATLLDAGCGYCHHTARLAKGGFRITAVDFSESAIEVARKNIESAGLQDQVRLCAADLTELPFADLEFDYIVCWGVLMHIPEMERALSELVRVLKPGGRLVFGENNRYSLHVLLWENVLRLVKKAIGRKVPKREYSQRGIEEWNETETGGLLVRKTDFRYLENFCRTLDLRRIARFAGQFTEIYTSLPGSALKRLVYELNTLYFKYISVPGPAIGNIVVFEKSEGHD